VVALGSNAAVSGAELDQALELVGPFARLMLVLPKELGGAPDPDGRLMRAFAEAHSDQVTILDWPAYSSGHGDWFAPDGLHVTTAGAQGLAQMIGEGVEFAPVPRADPPRERKPNRPRAPAADADPGLAAFWHFVGDTVAAFVTPGLRLLAGVFGDTDGLAQPDL
jgi:hypothetical protein